MRTLRGIIVGIAALMTALLASAQANELQTHVIFTATTPLASAHEILRRTYTPITAAPFGSIAGLPIDPAKERFALYIPPTKPSGGYGLMVFVPPWNGAEIPTAWSTVFDDDGVIFVSAYNSGNDAPVHVRRMPLALIAAENVMQKYDVNPAHVFVAGFSGGSKVALRLALAYPDVFHGAFLNSGSDPIGTSDVAIPPANLFRIFQQSSRIFYVTGNLDRVPYNMDRWSARSLNDFCVTNVNMVTLWGVAHESADESTLSKVLNEMFAPAPARSDDMADCRAKLDADVQAQLKQVQALIASGDKADARKLLTDLDAKYGGLAAPESLELNAKLR
jgi:pimeloyl-ACP methyl ester carboxylesterase